MSEGIGAAKENVEQKFSSRRKDDCKSGILNRGGVVEMENEWMVLIS